MPELKDVLEDVQREVKSFGDNVKGLDSTEKSLAEVRKLAEEAGAKAGEGTQLKADLKALSEGVAAKHEAIEKQVKDIEKKALDAAEARLNEIEKKLNRARLMNGLDGGDADAEMKSIREFHRNALAARGELKLDTDTSDEKINVDEIKAYRPAFAKYVRRGDRDAMFDVKSMSVGSDPDGGYFVTPFMSPRILSIIFESSPVRQLATVETDQHRRDRISRGRRRGRRGMGRRAGDASRDDDGPGRRAAHPGARDVCDAEGDAEAARGCVGEHRGVACATRSASASGVSRRPAFVTGDGIKKPRGFTTYANGTTRGFIEQIASGHATLLTFDGLISLTMALKEEYVGGASFMMRRASVGSCAPAQGRQRAVHLASRQPGRQAQHPSGPSGLSGGGYGGGGRGRSRGRVRQLLARLYDRRSARHLHAARSVHGQAVRAVLYAQARRRRCDQLRGDQAAGRASLIGIGLKIGRARGHPGASPPHTLLPQ